MGLFDIVCELIEWARDHGVFCSIRFSTTSENDFGVGGFMVIIGLSYGRKRIDNAFYCAGGYLSKENFSIGGLNEMQMKYFVERRLKEE